MDGSSSSCPLSPRQAEQAGAGGGGGGGGGVGVGGGGGGEHGKWKETSCVLIFRGKGSGGEMKSDHTTCTRN